MGRASVFVSRLKVEVSQRFRRLLLPILLLPMLLSGAGCSTKPSQPAMSLSHPPAVCLEVCRSIPEHVSDREWMLLMLEQYTACAVQNALCREVLGGNHARP